MTEVLRKWGNSTALRIPQRVLEEAHFAEGMNVRLSVAGDKIIIEPAPDASFTLAELLRGVTEENKHGEIFGDSPLGKEIW